MYGMPSPASLLHDLRTWPQTSQEQARRNAMIAATACAQRRVERQDVDDFLASMAAPAVDHEPVRAGAK
jgi:hypothetical protein